MTLVYPSRLSVSRLDYVWFEEGMAAGYIERIYDGTAPAESGYSEPSVLIDLFKPGSSRSILMGYPYSSFNDEGIDLISEMERNSISAAKRHIEQACNIQQSSMAVFKIFDQHEADKFPLIIVCYDESAQPMSAARIDDSTGSISHSDCLLDRLPSFAWKVKGGGRA